jgi:hypothetical protein
MNRQQKKAKIKRVKETYLKHRFNNTAHIRAERIKDQEQFSYLLNKHIGAV